ncbi:MAG: zinc metalloprotease HtpX [Candidatus Bathyarchaeota archaeon]|nr:zinc metalloprotease HtpX [Candidatus Bathyarchaeota archaeon]
MPNTGLLKLQITMATTVALIIGVTTLAFSAILWWYDALDITTLIATVAIFNIAQWLLAPYLVNFMYGVRKADPAERPELHTMLQGISQRSGIKTPQLMISKLTIPNAFAYGSPLTGNMVAVTDGLLTTLDTDEVEAVIAHETGHLKHRDMQIMMVVSFLPSLFYILARSLLYSSWFGGNNKKNNGSSLALVGGLSMIIYFTLTLLNLALSRQREYYADKHAAETIPDGAHKLSTGLAKISSRTWTQQRRGEKIAESGFKSLFIADPDRAGIDVAELQAAKTGELDSQLVDEILNRHVTGFDSFTELFSTHPNIVKRLQALQQ